MQKEFKIIRILVPLLTLFFSSLCIILFQLKGSQLTVPKMRTDVLGENHKPIAGYSIEDLTEANSIPYVNYTPNEYLVPTSLKVRGEKIDLNDKNFKSDRKGTFQFVFFNLNPNDLEFMEKSKKLSPYLQGDNRWHFTFYLPPVMSACVIYVDILPYERIGELADYAFIDYSEYQLTTIYHKPKSQPLFIDVSFYTRRVTLSPSEPLHNAKVITIHYEKSSERAEDILGIPMMGKDSEIRKIVAHENNILLLVLIISALTITVFIFLCYLKRTISFIPQILITLGIFGLLLGKYGLKMPNQIPYFWRGIECFSSLFILTAAISAVRIKFKKVPIWIAGVLLNSICTLLAFIQPYLPFESYNSIGNILKIGTFFSSVFLLLSCIMHFSKKTSLLALINPLLVFVISIYGILYSTKLVYEPNYWIFGFMILIFIVMSSEIFIKLEKNVQSLTFHLKEEVSRQTQSLTDIIEERNHILMFVSHDLKKPVMSIESQLFKIKSETKEPNLVKEIDYVLTKSHELIHSFNEVSSYSKSNFISENSEEVDLKNFFAKVFLEMNPDCEANGIHLTIIIKNSIVVYGKPKQLNSVIFNLIMNAIEHAESTLITITASRKKKYGIIKVTDNGRGLSSKVNLFDPHISLDENKRNSGLGLYLCKKSLLSMGGSIEFLEEDHTLSFIVSLPLA